MFLFPWFVRGNSNMSLFNFIVAICQKPKIHGNSNLSLFDFVIVVCKKQKNAVTQIWVYFILLLRFAKNQEKPKIHGISNVSLFNCIIVIWKKQQTAVTPMRVYLILLLWFAKSTVTCKKGFFSAIFLFIDQFKCFLDQNLWFDLLFHRISKKVKFSQK